MKKNTDDLRQELMETPDLDRFLQNNDGAFRTQELTETITLLCKEKKLSKAALAKRSCISEVYLHQILSGKRFPSRDRLLCLCFGLGLDQQETEKLLKLGGFAQLYPKEKRDAVILHGLSHGTPLMDVNTTLFSMELKTLF